MVRFFARNLAEEGSEIAGVLEKGSSNGARVLVYCPLNLPPGWLDQAMPVTRWPVVMTNQPNGIGHGTWSETSVRLKSMSVKRSSNR